MYGPLSLLAPLGQRPERMAGFSIAKDAPILYRSDRIEHRAHENGEHRCGRPLAHRACRLTGRAKILVAGAPRKSGILSLRPSEFYTHGRGPRSLIETDRGPHSIFGNATDDEMVRRLPADGLWIDTGRLQFAHF